MRLSLKPLSAGLLRYNKNAQLAIIAVEIKLGVLSQENATTIPHFGGNFARGAMQHGKNIAEDIVLG